MTGIGSESRSRPRITKASDSGAARSTPVSTGATRSRTQFLLLQPLEPSEGTGLAAAQAFGRLSCRGEMREIHPSNGWRRSTGGIRLRGMAEPAAVVDLARRVHSDYAILKGRVRDAGLLEKQPWFYARSIGAKLALLVACLAVRVVPEPLGAGRERRGAGHHLRSARLPTV